jgi:hypothetical protein
LRKQNVRLGFAEWTTCRCDDKSVATFCCAPERFAVLVAPNPIVSCNSGWRDFGAYPNIAPKPSVKFSALFRQSEKGAPFCSGKKRAEFGAPSVP